MNKKEKEEAALIRLNYREIGPRIRKQRILLGISREDLAKQIGITHTFLGDIELGTKGFSLKSLNRFCKALKMSPDTILYPPKNRNEDQYKNIIDILEKFPEDKRKIAEEMLTVFLLSHDSVE
ncbi:MAG: helix-turn-helix transcriptional regulator [Eubacterium sp.]